MTTATRTAKKLIGIISKKNSFARAAHVFVHFFAFCGRPQRETSKLRVLQRKCRICSCLPFFTADHFYLGLVFLIFSLPFFIPTKFVSFAFYLLFWLFLCYPRPCQSNVTFDIDLRKDERTDGHVITEFSRVYMLPFSYPWCSS